MTRLKRGTYAPEASFRHPLTGVMVRHADDQDAELLCMRARIDGGETGGVLDHARRVQELAHQSAQNRHRIVRKMLGGVEPIEKMVWLVDDVATQSADVVEIPRTPRAGKLARRRGVSVAA